MRSLAWFCLVLAACSSTSTTTPDPNVDGGSSTDAGTDSGHIGDAGDAGIPLDGVTKIVANSPGGGFVPPAPDGSPCGLGQQNYEYDYATKHLTYDRCKPGADSGDLYVRDQGAIDLTATQASELQAAVASMTINTDDSKCGADKAVYSVTVTRPSGSTQYFDSFYACQKGDKTYVDNMDDVFSTINGFLPSN